MKKYYGWKPSLAVLIAASAVLSGCMGDPGGGAGKVEEAETPSAVNEPVTVKLATSQGIFNEAEFKQYIVDPVAKKYPNINVEYINTSEKGSSLNEIIAAGNIPDIVVGYGSTIKSLIELQLFYNMEPLIKQNKFDVNRIIPEMIDYIRVNGGSNDLGGLPVYNNAFGLFYNKTLFDKFAVPYPKDGMTWEEIGDLGKKMTRNYDGVQYRGLFPDNVNRMVNQITLYQLDKDNKATITTDPWKKAFDLWESIYNYPGNSDAPYNTMNFGENQKAFVEGRLAMITGYSSTVNALKSAPDMNWDVVTYPQHKDNMGFSTNVDTPNMSITAQSKNKQAAFLVIETALSDEVQLQLARNGKMSVLSSEKVKEEFGKAIPEFAGKTYNLSSMTRLKPSVPRISKYQGSDTNKVILDAYESVLKKEKDINTALRDADEQINAIVQAKIRQE
ncbi:Bacterial extracellular solute-binding protein [Paenibacillus konkukensis]|uniref:Bacterial extracellular solute-binding protein n=1 Tax=Paenibacillus konkukensis TaxID=2020716 RepID=A0ABY4RXN8_9BACL|nr:extracellular solute-binding protein [Paenibacillus konkukensis]UQZ86308.1 Bacterial extracellular solute-binding protein [Paenibacillus konkukensis]